MNREGKNQKKTKGNDLIRKPLRLQKNHPPIIGIDIGSSYVKIVQMKKNSKLHKLGFEIIPEGMVNQGRIEASQPLSEIIRKTMSKYKIKGNECSLCLSGSEVIVRELKLPEMNENQIMDNLKHEITSFLPLNHDEYCIDYKVLDYIESENNTPGKLSIMVAAVPNNLVLSYINTLKKARLKVVYVDIFPNIAGKIAKWIMNGNNLEVSRSNLCLIDFGARSTNIVILKNGNYFIHKTVNSGGDYLTAIIAEKSNMDLIEAEEYKVSNKFFTNSLQNELSLHVRNFFDFLITDIERTIEFYKNRNNQKSVDHIYIMGGGSLLHGLDEYMEEHLSVKVFRMSDIIGESKMNSKSGESIAFFSHAIGSTLREER
ncbi:MAG: type IV pilus assembly protein PilM [Anaerocolumna sp.]